MGNLDDEEQARVGERNVGGHGGREFWDSPTPYDLETQAKPNEGVQSEHCRDPRFFFVFFLGGGGKFHTFRMQSVKVEISGKRT